MASTQELERESGPGACRQSQEPRASFPGQRSQHGVKSWASGQLQARVRKDLPALGVCRAQVRHMWPGTGWVGWFVGLEDRQTPRDFWPACPSCFLLAASSYLPRPKQAPLISSLRAFRVSALLSARLSSRCRVWPLLYPPGSFHIPFPPVMLQFSPSLS